MLGTHNLNIDTFDLHGQILCVLGGVLSVLLSIHNVGMDRLYVTLKITFLSCFVFTMWAWELLAFMDRLYVCLKVSFQGKCGSTM